MAASDTTDTALLAAVRAGDERVFARLVDELSPRMLKMARVYLAADAAEDAVQEAWIVVLRSLERFEGRSALATWVLGIVVNTARARGREPAPSPRSSPTTPRTTPRACRPSASCPPTTTAGRGTGRSRRRRGPRRRSRPPRPGGSSAARSPSCPRPSGP
jgi:hypothetical protein